MKTMFKNWTIDGYTAKSPDRKFELWIGNGFLSFRDHDSHYPKITLLQGASLWTRYKIWREFCKEREKRALEALQDNK